MENKNYYDVEAISNSSLSYLCREQGGSRLKYKKNYIDKKREESESPSLRNGKLIHLYIEDPSKFVVADINKPGESMSKLVEMVSQEHLFGDLEETVLKCARSMGYQSNWGDKAIIKSFNEKGKEYYDYLILKKVNELVLTSSEKELIEKCVNSLYDNPYINLELFEYPPNIERFSEYELYWTENITGLDLPCKGMIDKLDINHEEKEIIIKDFKTTSKPVAKYFEAFEYWRTHRQLAFYAFGLIKQSPELKDYKISFKVIVVETIGLHESRIFNINEDNIMLGRFEYIDLLKELAICKNNEWSKNIVYQIDSI